MSETTSISRIFIRHARVLVCLNLLLVAPVLFRDEARGAVFSAEPGWKSADTYIGDAVAFGDVDGDGDLDLVCGGSFQGAMFYPNDGFFSTMPYWFGVTSNTRSVALGDVDGDGDLDLVCTSDGSPRLHLNTGGYSVFSNIPAWSGPYRDARSLALGDVDGDGDLDLVCGCNGQQTMLYLNEGGIFADTAAWSSPAQNTTSVALGDVDGDGDIDLVCGNDGQSSVLYLNEGDALAMTPAWSGTTQNTKSVALGDIDGDGDLDLVCGNMGQGSVLYLNEGGGFSSTPAWTSPIQSTEGVALGDVDSDGDLDLVCGNQFAESALFLNEGGVFSSTAGWASPWQDTRSVALGDVDGDGDLDLMCGNAWGNTALFLNETGAFSGTPPWSFPSRDTRSVAFGDINGDGYPDLVCGNYNGSTMLFLNEEGAFSVTPAWSSPEQSTMSVALGDVDGDGDLDLVCGRYDASTLLYLNEGGIFSTAATWASPRHNTYSVSLGDVDGDGDLDLVCGNAYWESSALFLNVGGVFADTAAWSSPTMSIEHTALADIDCDGDLDLVLAGYNQGVVFYLNQNGVFSPTPVWPSPEYPTGIALGDMDGDGDLDLVCGSSGSVLYGLGRTTLYLNEGDFFSASPAWSSPEQPTTSVALGDVDGDGDLDLVCGNNGQSTALYVNNEYGVLSASPTWSSGARFTQSVAMEDVDNDGDLDLVCGGNDYGLTVLYSGAASPAFRGDPSSPTDNLPNNSAFLRDVRVWPMSKNLYRVRAKAIDVESDPVWIVPEYKFAGAYVWQWSHADMVGFPGNVGPLATSPAGVEHEFDWDISRVPLDRRNAVLRLRAISNPRRAGLIQRVASYKKELGRLDAHHPQIGALTSLLAFPTVTVGDTVALSFAISNTGNEPLRVTRIGLPSNEVRIDRETPFEMEPGQAIDVAVFLQPREETSIGGVVMIESNDPFNPVKAIPVRTDIRGLQLRSDMLASTPELPLGEAVTVVVTLFPQVRIERGHLFHRSGHGSGAFQDSIPLSKYKDNYIGTIPGSAITEDGLEYFIKVENSGVFASDPPGAPNDSVFSRPVTAPQRVTSAPQPNSGADFLEARDIKVQASLPTGAAFVQGTLHFREGGTSAYRASPFVAGDPLAFSIIPDSLAGPRGLEYWVEVQTLTSSLTDPQRAPEETPHSIRVTVPDLIEGQVYPEKVYRMISIPLDFGPEFTGTLEALLSDQAAFGPYDPVQWRAFRYLPASRKYAELSGTTREQFRPVPGRAFWLISANKNQIETGPVKGLSTATDSSYALVLEPGWNMIGDPFVFPVAWDSILVDGQRMADVESTVVEPPVAYVIGRGYRLGAETLEPFAGYWVKNLSDASVVLQIPPKEAPSTAMPTDSAVIASSRVSGPPESDWRIDIGASSCGAVDCGNFVGIAGGASSSWDKHDRSEPPMAPERAISLYFPHQTWEKHKDNYAADVRGEYEALHAAELKLAQSNEDLWGHIWRFDVAKNFSAEGVGDEATLELAGVESVPAEASIYLIDRVLEKLIDVRTERSYSFHLGQREPVSEVEARFVLIVGSEEFINANDTELPKPPERTVLHQNYPNPFNPSTIVRYEVAHSSSVRLAVYDASGALVRVLYNGHRQAGRYEEAWDGRNERGNAVAAGMYFCRLETGGGIGGKRKLILLR